MKAPCRLALLGCGAVSELYYTPALRYLEAEGTAVLAAVCDPDSTRAAQFCTQFPHASAYPDESFLQKTLLDAVIVASPASLHEAHVLRALDAGLSVLCEKPLAATVQAGERMIAAARAKGLLLAVGLLRRFYSNTQFIRQLIQSQTLGAVRSFSVQEGGPFDWPARSDSFFRKKTAGGGILLDIGVHVLDLIVHWFGQPERFTYADDAMGGLEANCRLRLSYPGFTGDILLSRDWATANLYRIEFERGVLQLRAGQAEQAELQIDGSPFALSGHIERRHGHAGFTAITFQQAFLAQLQDFILALQTSGTPRVTGEEGIRSLRLIEQCYQQRTLMEMPWLSPQERKTGQILAAGDSR